MATEIFKQLAALAIEAGNQIMKVYSGEFSYDLKDDNSPITAADRAAHDVIVNGLGLIKYEGRILPVISEEGDIPSYEVRKSWSEFWLIDPLDGTKEFISRNGEFTVNIALISGGRPLLGVVYIPVKEVLYFGGSGRGSFKISADDTELSSCRQLPLEVNRKPGTLIAAGSRSHRSAEFEGWVKNRAAETGCDNIEVITAGSSLKFCLAAEGAADVYPRFGPTMEWDTAAAHAIVEGAGKKCENLDGSQMNYNKIDMKNKAFVVF